MILSEYVDLLSVLKRYGDMMQSRKGWTRTKFKSCHVSVENIYCQEYVIRFNSKHGLTARYYIKESTYDEQSIFNGVVHVIPKECVHIRNKSVPERKFRYDFMYGRHYQAVEPIVYSTLSEIDHDEIESYVFQESLIHDKTEELALALGIIHNKYTFSDCSFHIRTHSHLGSTEQVLKDMTKELTEYMRYIR